MKLSNGTGGGGEFFEPKDHKDAKAVLLEPLKILRDQPGNYGKRDLLVADVTVFTTKDTLDGTEEPKVYQSVKISGAAMIRDHEDKCGKEASVGKFVGAPNKKGNHPIWVIRPVDQAAFERVAAYVVAREAALAAELDADEPDWMG